MRTSGGPNGGAGISGRQGITPLVLMAVEELGLSAHAADAKSAPDLRRALGREVSIHPRDLPRLRPYMFKGEMGIRMKFMTTFLDEMGEEALSYSPCDPSTEVAIERQMLQWLGRQSPGRMRELIEEGVLSFRVGLLGF